MKEQLKAAVCPLCGQRYTAPSALSRVDNKTPICPECGTRQALQSIGVPLEEQEHIIEVIRKYSTTENKGK